MRALMSCEWGPCPAPQTAPPANPAPASKAARRVLAGLGCRGPDSAGVAVLRDGAGAGWWSVRVAPGDAGMPRRLEALGEVDVEGPGPAGGSVRFRFRPRPGVTPGAVEEALGAAR